jgi:hypothetical protein
VYNKLLNILMEELCATKEPRNFISFISHSIDLIQMWN